ncbi:hypothetical protein FRAAL2574 [Frankia alni ACN14a]|uniref:Uncharacterized protein n=1 Tax=Frankia alni (strain DSM 45986 / CECT 9034 / ACN14a) TaxID=326424 RepID=Q0RMM6_FRAAA|nr:hypothetical protein FRAAL2574 [Frankia alni ACN14a]
MEQDEAERPSVAWVFASDVPIPDVAAALGSGTKAAPGLLPARRRVTAAVAAALEELRPTSQWISVAVGSPHDSELDRARTRLEKRSAHRCRRRPSAGTSSVGVGACRLGEQVARLRAGTCR